MKKKIIATILVLANVMTMAACTPFDFITSHTTEETDEEDDDDDDDDGDNDTSDMEAAVFETVDDIATALAKCNYDSFQRNCDGDTSKVEELMPVDDTDYDDDDAKMDKDLVVRNMIASTITYEIDEKSFNKGFMGSTCSVDVTFSYSDYYKVLEQKETFINPGDFNAMLAEVTDTIDTKITLEFKKHYNEYLLTNGNDLAVLYDYKDTELNYMRSLFDMVDKIYMTGAGWDDANDCYYDTNTFEIVLELNEQASEYIWQYVYRVSLEGYPNWTHLYTSDTVTDRYPTEIRITYTQDELFDDGFYCILFYNYYDDTIIGYEFDVYNTQDGTPGTEPTETTVNYVERDDSDEVY